MSNPYKDKTTVLLLGIFLGTIGVHRFYLGGKANTNRGWLILGLTVGGWLLSWLIIGFAGIIAAAVLVIVDLVKHGELTDQANAEIASGMRR